MRDGGCDATDPEKAEPTWHRGITLGRVLAVWGTIAVLAGLTVPFFLPIHCSLGRRFSVVEARNLIVALELAIRNFRVDNGRYPWPTGASGKLESADMVRELIPGDPRITAGRVPAYNKKAKRYLPSCPDKYIEGGTLVDPLGNEFRFKWDGAAKKLLIYSIGPNETDEGGGGDDVSSL